MKKTRIPAAVTAFIMMFMMSSCGNSSSGSDGSPGAAESSQAQSSDASQAPAVEYDINGDIRLFNSFKEKYDGNYKLTGTLTINENTGGSAVCFEVKGDLRLNSAVVDGMMTKRYITAEGDLYVISEGTTTYKKFNHDEIGNTVYKSPSYDPVFSGTGVFSSASVDGGEVTEEYALNFDGMEGTIKYTFDAASGDIRKIVIDSTDMNNTHEEVTDIVMSEPADADFELPDLSGYTRND